MREYCRVEMGSGGTVSCISYSERNSSCLKFWAPDLEKNCLLDEPLLWHAHILAIMLSKSLCMIYSREAHYLLNTQRTTCFDTVTAFKGSLSKEHWEETLPPLSYLDFQSHGKRSPLRDRDRLGNDPY